jgi:hypothetical protein
MVSLSLIATALAASAPVQPEGRPETIEIGARRFGGWQAKAETEVDYGRVPGDSSLPSVREVRCQVATNGLTLRLDRLGEVGIGFGGDDPKANDEYNRSFSTGSVRWIAIDGKRLQVKVVHTGYPRWKFDDVAYPRHDDDDVILPVFSGHLAVRSDSSDPWLHVSTLLGRLMRAHTLTIGHGHQIDGRVPRVYAVDVPLSGLRDALLWCQRRIDSAAAYRFRHEPPPPAAPF